MGGEGGKSQRGLARSVQLGYWQDSRTADRNKEVGREKKKIWKKEGQLR